jgi:anaerobic selenocysteine-containing dehydrogenase
MVIGANPTDGHPVFASRMKKRLREGAKLIVVDPRRTEMVKSPHIKAAHHLPLTPGTNVAVVTALAHVIVTEGLYDEASSASAATGTNSRIMPNSSATPPQPRSDRDADRRSRKEIRGARGCLPPAATARSITASA